MRLDVFLAERGFVASRTDAKNLIIAGAVTVAGKTAVKPSLSVDGLEDKVSVDTSLKKYVSRGGLKLEAAIDRFSIDVQGKLALDVGASSGGFTDCLLKHGAKHVIAVDSGSGQLSGVLASDERVSSLENYNARYMCSDDLEYIPELAVMDVSFISATHIIPAIYRCICEDADFVCLVKPQFEVGRANIGKGGIVRDEKARARALSDVIAFAENVGFSCLDFDRSPIQGGDGNIEYLVHFKKVCG